MTLSFKFLNQEDIKRLMEFEYLREYLEHKTKEIGEHNKKLGINTNDLLINGRRLTNVGTFRYYINEYLRNNSKIHKKLTFIVRQLQPTEKGLPCGPGRHARGSIELSEHQDSV